MLRKPIQFLIFFLLAGGTSKAQLNIQFRSQLPYGTGNDLANIGGYVDSTGKEYALVGCQTGLSIVDVSNPAAPFQKILIPGTNSIWREVKVWGKYAYVTTEGGTNGLQIINLGKLPGTITTADYKYWKGDGAILNQLARMHSLHIDNGYAYLNGPNGANLFGGACLIVSLADPWNPSYKGNTQLSFTGNARYVHDCYVRNDTLWGAHIYSGFFSIISVANKNAPVLLGIQTTPGAFTHNAWLSDAGGRTLFTTDEVSNSYMTAYDVNNFGNITELDRVQLNPGSNAIVHNTHIKNNYAIVSWYKEGVAIIDVSRPDNLIITGSYDTYTQGSGSGFNGCWGVYPYLPSGNLIASDINNGLFVLTPTYVRGCYLEGTVTDACTGLAIPNITVAINGTNISKQGKTNGIYKTGTAIPGTYSVTFSKSGYLSKTISGVVLNNGILNTLNVMLNDALAVSITDGTVQDVKCYGESNGSINVTAAGGKLPYAWQWNDGQTIEDRNNIPVGSYTVTLTDGNGCSNSATYYVSQPAPLSNVFSSSTVTCIGSSDGVITAVLNGGTPPYNYQWILPPSGHVDGSNFGSPLMPSTATDTINLMNLSGGDYTLIVADTNLCELTDNYHLNVPSDTCVLDLNIRVFIQGLYVSSNQMKAVTDPIKTPLIADTIIVQLVKSNPPRTIAFTDTGTIGTNGWGTFTFRGNVIHHSYYIVLHHRHSLETWSKLPITFNSSQYTFDFTNSIPVPAIVKHKTKKTRLSFKL